MRLKCNVPSLQSQLASRLSRNWSLRTIYEKLIETTPQNGPIHLLNENDGRKYIALGTTIALVERRWLWEYYYYYTDTESTVVSNTFRTDLTKQTLKRGKNEYRVNLVVVVRNFIKRLSFVVYTVALPISICNGPYSDAVFAILFLIFINRPLSCMTCILFHSSIIWRVVWSHYLFSYNFYKPLWYVPTISSVYSVH